MRGEKITNLAINLLQKTTVLITEINTSPIYWEKKSIGAFVTIRDITERKQTEQELERQKTYFQALFESSPEAIVSMTSNHRVLDVNPAFTTIFGFSAEDLREQDIDDYILPNDYAAEGRELTTHVIAGKTTKIESVRRCKDDSLVPVSILGAPIFVEGKQVGIYAIYRDISDRKEAEEEREFYNSLLRHDVANRNMVVQGNLEILDSLHLTPEQQNLVSNALHAVKASTNLIQKIRDLRAIEGEHTRSPIDLQKAVESAVKASRQQAEELAVTITIDPCKVTVMAGPFIDNIITNILQNAIIHSGCKNINFTCDEVVLNNSPYCALSIADDGKGIAPEVKRDIFRPGIKRRGSPGSGLGLYLVKKMVENYGGRIAVSNHNGNGTVFTLYLERV
jgi:PAS domain S-box-containing protein